MENEFDVIILCAGTVGSTLIVSKYLNLQKIKIRFYNNPMMQICYYNPNLYFRKEEEFIFENSDHLLVKVQKSNHFCVGWLIFKV